MYIEKPLPFYAAYPLYAGMEQEQEHEKDLQKMKTYYSKRCAKIQQLVEDECDQMEYDGSMMFDEYPDKLMMENLCRKIENRYLSQENEDSDEMQAMDRRRNPEVRDLIRVLLFNEMFCRRCRHRRHRNYYYY
ncbi:hypothetical protein [Blautia liquoris]|nr:hypothetical protein [Blautia liquoris]